jgi:hypothetical protein
MAKNKTADQRETSREFWWLVSRFGICILAVVGFFIVWGEFSGAIATAAFATIVWGLTFIVLKAKKQI